MPGDDDRTTSGKSKELRPNPGPRPPKHIAEKHLKSTEGVLAAQHLLVVAHGGEHPDVEILEEWDLDLLPLPPPDHPQYLRILSERNKMERENVKIRKLAKTRTLQAWTELYNHLLASCEDTHPTLHDEMYALCRLDKRNDHTHVPGGYADGPRAYQLYLDALFPDERTKMDREIYEKALKMQQDNPLPALALPSEFRKRALTFITDINENLARKFSPNDAGEHILSLLPRSRLC